MNATTTALFIAAAVIVGTFYLIYLIDRRAKRDGGLFTKPPSHVMRVFAVLLGLVFAAVAYYELTISESLHLELVLVAVALIAYGFGSGELLGKLQRAQPPPTPTAPYFLPPSEPPLLERLGCLLGLVLVVLLGGIAVFYGLLWIIQTPVTWLPFVLGVTICIGVVGPLAFLFNLTQLFKRLK